MRLDDSAKINKMASATTANRNRDPRTDPITNHHMTTQAPGSTMTFNGTLISAEDRLGFALAKFTANVRWLTTGQEHDQEDVGAYTDEAEEIFMERFDAETYTNDNGNGRIKTWTLAYLEAMNERLGTEASTEKADQRVETIYGPDTEKEQAANDKPSKWKPAAERTKEASEDEEDDESETEDDYEDERREFEHRAHETNEDKDAYEKENIGYAAACWLDGAYEHNTDEAVKDGKEAYLAALRRSDSPETAGDAAIARWYKRQEEQAEEGTKEREERLDQENEEKGGTTLASGCRITAEDRNQIAKKAFTQAATWIAKAKAEHNITDPDDITKVYWLAETAYTARFNGSQYGTEWGEGRVNTWTGEFLTQLTIGNRTTTAELADRKEKALYGPR